MERVAGEVEGVHFGIGDPDAFFVGSLIERALDLEARLGRRRADEFDDGNAIRQRPAAPVLRPTPLDVPGG
jgi:hypothetical protein